MGNEAKPTARVLIAGIVAMRLNREYTQANRVQTTPTITLQIATAGLGEFCGMRPMVLAGDRFQFENSAVRNRAPDRGFSANPLAARTFSENFPARVTKRVTRLVFNKSGWRIC